MSDNRTSVDGHKLNQSLSSPQIHQNPLHYVVSHSSSSGWVGGLQQACILQGHSSWYTTFHWIHSYTFYCRLCPPLCRCTWWRHEFRWCSWLPRNCRHHVLVFLNFPSIISELYIWRVRLVPTFHNSIWKLVSAHAMPGSRRLGERFQWRRVPLFRYSSCMVAFNEVLSFWQLRYRKKQCSLWAGISE